MKNSSGKQIFFGCPLGLFVLNEAMDSSEQLYYIQNDGIIKRSFFRKKKVVSFWKVKAFRKDPTGNYLVVLLKKYGSKTFGISVFSTSDLLLRFFHNFNTVHFQQFVCSLECLSDTFYVLNKQSILVGFHI